MPTETTVPEEIWEAMADAMLEPPLRSQGISTLPSGNLVRKTVLRRALAAASAMGWRLQHVEG